MMRLLILPLLIALAACAPAPASSRPLATPVLFPTMTPGQVVSGVLPTVAALPLDGAGPPNPATAVALANRPTATPDHSACPPPGSPVIGPVQPNSRALNDEMNRFLSAGGAPAALEAVLRDDWGILGETGWLRADIDLTGEGLPEVIGAYNAPDGRGHLVVFSCVNGVYSVRYEADTGPQPAQIVFSGDMNRDGRANLLYIYPTCPQPNACVTTSQIVGWRGGALINLLSEPITSPDPPEVRDVDDDGVLELVVRQTSRGTTTTGPLRTGVLIYDWDGVAYARSITQLDPPRFRIQVVHEADRQLIRREVRAAIDLYELALRDSNLARWFGDEDVVLTSYILFRLVTAYAFAERQADTLTAYQNAVAPYPDPAAGPAYVVMADAFWNAFQVTNNMRSACAAVQDIITARPEALELINRYGSRSPTYRAGDLCPF